VVQRDRDLLERGGELEQLRELVDAAGEGRGGLVIVEGEAGIGKTRLLGEARTLAEARGLTVLSGRGGELERDLGYGVVRQLFEPYLRTTPDPEREALLGGAAAPAAAVLGLGGEGRGPLADASLVAEHSLYWLTENLASRRPLMLCVDDAHWSDLASLRWLVYLARRLEGTPVGVAVGWRVGEPDAPVELLAALRDEPEVRALAPRVLSGEACDAIVREVLGAEADDDFCAACAEVSGGNPFLLGELALALAAEGVAPTAEFVERVAALGPAAVTRSVLVRLSRLPPAAAALARALAVLENDAQLHHAARLAGLSEDAAPEVMRALAAAHIVDHGGSPRFAHPVLRTAVYCDLGEPP
jgi:predicted ATPase